MKRLVNRFWYCIINVGIGYSILQFVDRMQLVEKHICIDIHPLGVMFLQMKHQIIVSLSILPNIMFDIKF